jgi:hypothetical protein
VLYSYVPEALGSLPRSATHCTYTVRVSPSGVPDVPHSAPPPPYYYYITVPRAVAPQVFKEDEWKLFALGGAMGLAIGVAQAYALTR